MDTVSVVIPAYNVASLLPRCVESLLAQSHQPLEIIIVDDGSTDETAAVIASYERRVRQVHGLYQRHRGLGPARNAALSLASGDFIAMVDADDWVAPDFFADLLRIARERDADVVVGGFSFDVWGRTIAFPFLPRVRTMTGPEAAELSLHLSRFPSFAWNKLYRRSLFREDDPPFPSIYYEDLATTPRILLRAGTVAFHHETYYHYCLRKDSITGAFGAKNVFSFLAAIDILRHFLHESGLWAAWRSSYLALLANAGVMMAIQILLQPTRIPLRHRGLLFVRFAHRLRALARRPDAGRRLRTVRLRTAHTRGVLPRRRQAAHPSAKEFQPGVLVVPGPFGRRSGARPQPARDQAGSTGERAATQRRTPDPAPQ